MSGLAVDPEHAASGADAQVFVDHYNNGRPHRSLGLVPPNGRPLVKREPINAPIDVRPRDRLGGLLHEYERAA
jgi:hypothetical protein